MINKNGSDPADMLKRWTAEPAVADVLNRLIDLVDRHPMAQRGRPPQLRLKPGKTPVFFDITATPDREFVWELLEAIAKLRWIKLKKPGRRAADVPPYEAEPQIILTAEGEEVIREALDRPAGQVSWRAEWLAAVNEYFTLPEARLSGIQQHPIRVPGRSNREVLEQLVGLTKLEPTLYLREASAAAFWGISKLLDARRGAITQLVGNPNAFPEKPVLINVHTPGPAWESVLFIENETTYHSAVKNRLPGVDPARLAVVWVSGFMGAARRLRTSEGVSMHVSLMSHPEGIERLVSAWTDITSALETWFFGDLDFAAVEILRALREIFPGTRAWEPGYRVLLERAKRGESHGPDEDARKGEQPTFAGETGCHFTDTRLLPFLNRCTRYVDQEAYIPDAL